MRRRLNPHARMGQEIVRVLCAEADKAAREAIARSASLAERVHRSRTDCKRIRAGLQLIRSQAPEIYHRENSECQDLARQFSRAREAEVLLATFNRVGAAQPRRFDQLRRRLLAHRRNALRDRPGLARDLAAFAQRMRAVSRRLARVRIEGEGFAAVVDGVGATYRRAREAFRQAHATAPAHALHRWRKRAKAHAEHCRLLRAAWPGIMKRVQRELSDLGQILGSLHDLDELRAFLTAEHAPVEERAEARVLLTLMNARRRALVPAAMLAGRRLFAEKPDAFQRRLARWWAAAGEARSEAVPAT